MAKENVRILLFHRIGPENDFPGNFISPELFEQVLIYLSKNYSAIALESYFFQERVKLPKQPVILTFDGWHHGFIEYTLPLLKKYKLPATVFISSECVDHNMPEWNQLIDFYFSKTKKLAVEESQLKIDFLIKTKWESNSSRIKYANTLKKQLQSVSLNDRWKIIQFYVEQFSDVILPANLMMNWGDLQFMKEQGIEIGSLMILVSLPTTTIEEEQLDFALRNSALTIREKLGNTPSAVSFTTKRNNSRIKNLIHRAGYKLGLAVGQKIYMHGKYGRYALPRIELFNESFLKTKLRINGTISRLRSLIGQ